MGKPDSPSPLKEAVNVLVETAEMVNKICGEPTYIKGDISQEDEKIDADLEVGFGNTTFTITVHGSGIVASIEFVESIMEADKWLRKLGAAAMAPDTTPN